MPLIGVKKAPLPLLPEPVMEPIQGTAIVIIQPGSFNLRIGRASDNFPRVLPHCIARRHKNPGKQKHYEDLLLSRKEYKGAESKQLQKQGFKLAQDYLRNKTTSAGTYRQCTSYKQIAEMNSGVEAEISDTPSPIRWTDTIIKREYLIGDEALYVHPEDHYNLHWPVARGQFNLHKGPGGTLSAVVQDLETIWSYVIQNYLDIPLKDLKHYRAVLLIPDVYSRPEVREMVTVLLERLGFGAAFTVQESMCATFGTGVSSACVVDVGDQKTSVCCVEDGLVQKKTRLVMEVGGSDVTRCLHWMLSRSGFPYKECNTVNRTDALFLKSLKEDYCHLNMDICGMDQKRIQVKHPNQNIVSYTVQMGDERILAPMCMYYPEVYGLIGPDLMRIPEKYESDPSDPLDEDYLNRTMSKHEQAARLVALRKKESKETVEQASQNSDPAQSMLDDIQMDDDDTMDQPDGANTEAPSGGGLSKLLKKLEEEEEGTDFFSGLMGLDEAVLKSIDICDIDEVKRRMYCCIIPVGGGLMFPGAQSWLQDLVWKQISPHIRASIDPSEIFTHPKDMDPRITCWRGASIMCCLDTAQELWIGQREWMRFGVKLLRERAPYVW